LGPVVADGRDGLAVDAEAGAVVLGGPVELGAADVAVVEVVVGALAVRPKPELPQAAITSSPVRPRALAPGTPEG
jgi:hypothetical protein